MTDEIEASPEAEATYAYRKQNIDAIAGDTSDFTSFNRSLLLVWWLGDDTQLKGLQLFPSENSVRLEILSAEVFLKA